MSKLLITPQMVRKARKSGRNLVYVPLLFKPAVQLEGEELHTVKHPRCSDLTCPCQQQADREAQA